MSDSENHLEGESDYHFLNLSWWDCLPKAGYLFTENGEGSSLSVQNKKILSEIEEQNKKLEKLKKKVMAMSL